jgi:thioredoxin 1
MIAIEETSGVWMVKFGATWCSPCKLMAKTIASILPDFTSINYQDVDTDDEPELSKQYKIKSVPTVIFFKDGKETDRVSGSIRAEALRAKIREVLDAA